jgi:membrane associated rhomboid family serine protease
VPLTAVNGILALNVLAFVFTSMLPQGWKVLVDHVLGLSGPGLAQGMMWQFVTYQFIHMNLFHLIVNMLGLWFVGVVLERVLGGPRFVLLYLMSGIAGGVLQLMLSPGPLLIGASGAVCGLVAAFSTMYPRMPITALIFFVIPVRMQAMWLGIILVGVSLFCLITGLFGDVGNGAHIGGALAGYLWVKYSNLRFRVVR